MYETMKEQIYLLAKNFINCLYRSDHNGYLCVHGWIVGAHKNG